MNVERARAYNAGRADEGVVLRALGWAPWADLPVGSAAEAEAVAAWQRGGGLPADGMAGPATWAKLRAICAPDSWQRAVPRGKAQVLAAYGGNPRQRGWSAANLVRVELPHQPGRHVRVHRVIAEEFQALLALAVKLSGYGPRSVQTWNVRNKRGGDNPGSDLSTHSWAIAFDVDPSANGWGNKPGAPVVKHPLFPAVFRVAGWSCGCDWKTPDTMHFQAARGY